jgi:hypothetical protein
MGTGYMGTLIYAAAATSRLPRTASTILRVQVVDVIGQSWLASVEFAAVIVVFPLGV